MGGLHCIWRFPNTQFNGHLYRVASSPPCSPFPRKSFLLLSPLSQPKISTNKIAGIGSPTNTRSIKNGRALSLGPPLSLPQKQQEEENGFEKDEEDDEDISQGRGNGNWTIVLSSSLVGLLTGLGVVLFNYSVRL